MAVSSGFCSFIPGFTSFTVVLEWFGYVKLDQTVGLIRSVETAIRSISVRFIGFHYFQWVNHQVSLCFIGFVGFYWLDCVLLAFIGI